jgi:hypothetical protein
MKFNTSSSVSNTSSHVEGVHATSGGLVKATLGAIVVASAILTFVWLPAEYGIDPTGVGHVLGLTEMGDIKEQLHAEADADAKAVQMTQSGGLELNAEEIILRLDAIQAQLSAVAVSVGAVSITADEQDSAQPTEKPISVLESAASTSPWRDEFEYTLVPGEGIEVKLAMDEGAATEFYWSANGAVLNHDTHGDGSGQSISYEKGRAVPDQTGQLTAAFSGNHGWYWRNRSNEDVLMTLRTRGDYKRMVLPKNLR